MTTLSIHPTTKKHLDQLIKSPPQSLLLTGKKGVGLGTISVYLGEKIANKTGVILVLPDEKGTIKIDAVRTLRGQLRTRSTHQRAIIIDNADKMTMSSQNAFLKLLEEPPNNISFILTSHAPQQLLPTIRSRIQNLTVRTTQSTQDHALITSIGSLDDKKSAQIKFLASGLPAEITRLISDSEYFTVRSEEITRSRNFISQKLYQKMIIIAKISNNREEALTLIQDSLMIVRLSITSHPTVELSVLLNQLLQVEEKLLNDGHVKTQLLRFATT